MFNGGGGRRRATSEQKVKHGGKTVRRILREARAYWLWMMLALFLAALGSFLSAIAPNKLSELTDKIEVGLLPGATIDLNAINTTAIFLVVLYLASAFAEWLQSFSMASASTSFARDLRNKISQKINRLPLRYFDKHQTGDALSRVTNDIDTAAQGIDESLPNLVSAVTLLLGATVMMFVTNWILAIVAIAASLFGFGFMSAVVNRSQKYFDMRQTELGKLNAHIEEVYSGLNIVKAYNGAGEANRKFDYYNRRVYEASRRSRFLSGLMGPFMGFIGNFGYVAVCIAGAILAHNDMITFGVIVAFIMYVRLFSSPLQQIAQSMTSLQSMVAASERVFEFLDEAEISDQSEIHYRVDKESIRGDIEFDHVRFGYENNKPVINDFTASVKAGQKVAIVGPTGAGKTTLVNLLMKFYEIDAGDIRIDGVSTRQMTREDIHSLFTMVLQDSWTFSGSIRDNIVYNRRHISDQQIYQACREVGLEHFIKTLPKGLNASIDENESISAGQKQLLTIARGMIEDAPFLILDEATSNVDTRTEEIVQAAMDKLMRGRTSFIIAHRLSTIKNADLILVMDHGNIVETGTHDSLMKQKGFYAELYNSQFSL